MSRLIALMVLLSTAGLVIWFLQVNPEETVSDPTESALEPHPSAGDSETQTSGQAGNRQPVSLPESVSDEPVVGVTESAEDPLADDQLLSEYDPSQDITLMSLEELRVEEKALADLLGALTLEENEARFRNGLYETLYPPGTPLGQSAASPEGDNLMFATKHLPSGEIRQSVLSREEYPLFYEIRERGSQVEELIEELSATVASDG